VLAEREHMAATARRTALRDPALNDAPAALLGDVVAHRLRERGIDPDAAGWDSWRREDSRWQIVVSYHRPPPANPAEPTGAEGASPLEASSQAIERAQFVFDPARRTIGADNDSARLLTAEQRSLTAEAAAGLLPMMTGALADDHADRLDSDDWPEAGSSGRDRGGHGSRRTADHERRPDSGDAGRIKGHAAAGESDLTAGAGAPAVDEHAARAPVTDGTSALGSGVQPRPRQGGAAAFLGDDGRAIPRVGGAAVGGLVPLPPGPPRRPLQRGHTDPQPIRR